MPQEHHVLRCFSCETFQVHIVKKAKKWECKICGAKQSLKKNYGKGSGKDCRAQVMKLNELRMLKADTSSQIQDESSNETLTDVVKEGEPIEKKPVISKWAGYLDEVEPDVEDKLEDNIDWVNEIVEKKRKREVKRNFDNRKKICNPNSTTEDISCVMMEEPSNSSTTLNQEKNLKFDYSNKKLNGNCSLIQSNSLSKVKQSKYSKYLDEDESESNTDLLGIKKSSNVFDSNPTDLDNILNF